jgi:putative DNA methylase
MLKTRKKLIEVALPLDAINAASAREKSIRHGHPSTLHLWWARRPLAAARAVIFAQMVDDPSAHPDLFPTDREQERERQRLFRIIEELVLWENTTNETVLQAARDEIWKSWKRACAEKRQEIESRKKEIGEERAEAELALYDPDRLPAFHDPFAGGGALPLEAQRLGLEAYASDLNPVAVLINKAMIEIPPKFAGRPPVNPESRKQWIGNRGTLQPGGYDALSGADRLAEGDGSGEGGLSAGAAAASRGDVRDAIADHAGGSIHSGEHRGGMGEGVEPREGAVPLDRSGLAGGDRDVPHAVRGDRLVPGEGDGTPPIAAHGSREDADHPAAHLPRKAVTPESGKQEIGNSDAHGAAAHPTSYSLFPTSYSGAQGLAEDVRHYGQWMRDEAEKRIGTLYPKIEVTAEMAKARPDLKKYEGRKLTVIAWLWARTVKSPNPAFAKVDVPLASTFMLSTKAGKEAYVEPVIEDGGYRFTVKVGKPKDAEAAKNGTKLSRGANFQCLMSGTPMAGEHIYGEANAGRMGARLMAIVAEGDRGRVYLAPTPEHVAVALDAKPEWKPDVAMPENPRWFSPPLYGLKTYGDLFTPRQLVALTTFSDLVGEARERIRRDALAAGLPDDDKPLRDGGTGATAYAEAVGVYLGMSISKVADAQSSLCR